MDKSEEFPLSLPEKPDGVQERDNSDVIKRVIEKGRRFRKIIKENRFERVIQMIEDSSLKFELPENEEDYGKLTPEQKAEVVKLSDEIDEIALPKKSQEEY